MRRKPVEASAAMVGIKMNAVHGIVVFCGTIAVASSAQAGCLEEATTFAINLCGDIERSGLKETANGSVQANASLNSIIKKFIDASGSAGGQASIEKYEGVAQNELAKDRFDTRSCRQSMAKTAVDVQCKKNITFSTCSKPEFGLERWASEVVQDGNSGWMGGGHSQGEYCGNLTGSVIAQHQIGPQHNALNISSGENHRKDWKGHVEYNYSCRVKVQWNPVFKSQTDPLCGVAVVN